MDGSCCSTEEVARPLAASLSVCQRSRRCSVGPAAHRAHSISSLGGVPGRDLGPFWWTATHDRSRTPRCFRLPAESVTSPTNADREDDQVGHHRRSSLRCNAAFRRRYRAECSRNPTLDCGSKFVYDDPPAHDGGPGAAASGPPASMNRIGRRPVISGSAKLREMCG